MSTTETKALLKLVQGMKEMKEQLDSIIEAVNLLIEIETLKRKK